MMDVVKLIRERKWDTLVILIAVVLLAISTPITFKHIVGESVETGITKAIVPIADAIIKNSEQLEENSQRLKNLEDMRISEIIDRGIAAYKKISTVDQLETSTQNAASIKIALQVPEARAILFKIDREKTLLFEDYFFGDTPA